VEEEEREEEEEEQKVMDVTASRCACQ